MEEIVFDRSETSESLKKFLECRRNTNDEKELVSITTICFLIGTQNGSQVYLSITVMISVYFPNCFFQFVRIKSTEFPGFTFKVLMWDLLFHCFVFLF